MPKTIKEINEKIKKKKAVVVTAEEIISIVEKKGAKKAAQEVDVVTTGTFGPMCSSGAYFNIGHAKPKIKLGGGSVTLNDVPAYAAFAAADIYIGATALPDNDPRNRIHPGEFKYGGGHVIEDLVAGKDIKLSASTYGTNCYPAEELNTYINIKDLNEAVLFNPRNCYQNYNCAVNLSNKIIYTYMGVLRAKMGNATYCSAGQLSPLLNDPYYRTIGVGTKIFLGGAEGYVVWNGTQHNPCVKRAKNGTPLEGAGTLAVLGDLKKMSGDWLRGASFLGYGVSLAVGIGIPIPILDEEMVKFTAVKDEEIWTEIIDYSKDYPQRTGEVVGEVNYGQLKSGHVKIKGKDVPTAGFSSYSKALEIAEILKKSIREGKFLLTEPVAKIPSVESNIVFRPLKERPFR
ncbi:MAG: homocysteine biosynthesis protein [Candidatus Omnitrophota bacterium]